ncbi:uncharacterized protein LOC123507965 isoform X1 [Portunus trituberculatus]|uniref:uncharacterized protein LOC123507965 isoform X1 n=1 Tax=Portunus trituberculatus TaxID=210409 RepID=UPI001E1CF7D1|nr:uncharacterized protein LOC123507965 isoform X1 [Portunus trituberculatus]
MASQGAHPACLFLALTLLMTGAATAILCTAILTNYWELITFDREAVEAITARHNNTHTLTWLWEGKVGKVVIQLDKPLKVRRQVGVAPLGEARGVNANNNLRFRRQTSRVIYLVPHHGGIWTLCVGLSDLEQEKLRGKFRLSGCINYLSPHSMGSSDKNDWVQSKSRSVSITSSCSTNSTRKDGWVQRMQNLSISCALVCCILLGASAVVGIFGIIQRQISAVLITGVMYILASTFGLFCLTIMHFKRRTKKDCGVLDSQVTPEYSSARVFETGWSLDLGWGGVVTCLAAALLWLLLARIMRYNPISLS